MSLDTGLQTSRLEVSPGGPLLAPAAGKLSGSPSGDSSHSRQISPESTANREAWDARLRQLLQLSEAILAYLACLVKQDEVPLSPKLLLGAVQTSKTEPTKGVSAPEHWSNARRQLDKIFRSLAMWRKDFKDDGVHIEDDRLFIEDVDGVLVSLLNVAHQLMHLVDLDSPGWNEQTLNFREKAKKLGEDVEELQAQGNRSSGSCASCGQTPEERGDYLESLKDLLTVLKEESLPLQLTLRRQDWMRHYSFSRREPEEETLVHKNVTL